MSNDGKEPIWTGFGEGAPLTFRELQRENVARVPSFGMDLETWSPMEWCCAASGELGELANVLKKRQRKPHPTLPNCDVTGKPTPTLKDAADEIADTIIYLDLLASRLGIDVSNAVRSKWNEVSAKMKHDRRLA